MPKILIIDDDPAILRYLNLVFHKAGYAVFEASTTVEAMAILWKEQIDLLVTDIQMAKPDGFDTVVAIKQKSPKTPIVLISAYPKDERIEKALRYPGVTFVPKPINVDELMRTVTTLLPTD